MERPAVAVEGLQKFPGNQRRGRIEKMKREGGEGEGEGKEADSSCWRAAEAPR